MYSSGQREGKGTASGATLMTPTRLMAARKMMGDRVAQTAAEEFQEGETMSSATQPPWPCEIQTCSRLAIRDSNHPPVFRSLVSNSPPLSSTAGTGYGITALKMQCMRRHNFDTAVR